MAVLHLDRIRALWYTPAVTVMRCQMAYMERHGREQKWSDDALDRFVKALDEHEQRKKATDA